MGWLVDQSVFNRRRLLFWQFPKCMTISEQQIYTNYQAIYPATSSLTVYSTRWPSHRDHKKDLTFVRSDLLQEKNLQFPAQDSWQRIKRVTLFLNYFGQPLPFGFVGFQRCDVWSMRNGSLPFTTWAWIQEFRGVMSIQNKIGWRCFQMKYLQTAGWIFNSTFTSNI